MGANDIFRPGVMRTIEETLAALSNELRELSLKIHGEQFPTTPSPVKSGAMLCRSPRAWFPRKVGCLNPFSPGFFPQRESVADTHTIL